MSPAATANLHFFLMILASLLVFIMVVRIIIPKEQFREQFSTVLLLSVLIVVLGMLFGKYGANWGLPWWIYYPVPMFANVLLPPIVLRLNRRKTVLYLMLSFLSAPLIHAFFSFFLGWQEYMPFWKIPFWRELM